MGFNITLTPEGKYDWTVYSSAYGCIVGLADTLDEAKVEMMIAESDLYEMPLPPTAVTLMRANYAAVAKDLPDPPVAEHG